MIAIVPAGLDFGLLTPRADTRRIIIHHSASPDVPAAVIHGWHLAKGWSGIGYHFVIRMNGSVEAGRPLEMIGAHAGAEVNRDSIGICLTGNFMEAKPADAQLSALVQLIDYLEYIYGKVLQVLRHQDVASTDCPGDLFPWPEINWPRVDVNQGSGPAHDPLAWKMQLVDEAMARNLITELHNPDDPAPRWFVLAVGLNLLKEVEKTQGDGSPVSKTQ